MIPSNTASHSASDTLIAIPRPRWVISDTHFSHANILAYCPWRQTWASTLAEHDAAILAAWKACVRPEDWVLHLGDVCLGSKDDPGRIRALLPGRIILVRGNHDRSRAAMIAMGYDVVCSAAQITVGDHTWICRHNPAAFSVREAPRCVRLLHGHSHGNGYAPEIHQDVVAKARDCSLDALRSIGPVAWESICD